MKSICPLYKLAFGHSTPIEYSWVFVQLLPICFPNSQGIIVDNASGPKKITKRVVDGVIHDPERDLWIWDKEIKGFGLRVRYTGRKTYVIQYRAGGRTRRMTVGVHGRMTPEQARKRAKGLLADVDRGGDPAEDKVQMRQALTVKQLADRYLNEHARPKKKASSAFRDQRLLERFILPDIGNRKVNALTRAEVAKLHHRLGGTTPIQANRALAVLSKMMSLAIRWGLREGDNPCKYVERFKERKRERYLDQDELARLGKALIKVENERRVSPSAIGAIRFLALTGMRVGEVIGLKWEWVDFERQVIFLPDSKTGQKMIVLAQPALDLLADLPRVAGNRHCFPGQKFGAHLVDINGPWRLARKEAGLEGVRLHDLRHTHASVGAGAGLSLTIIGALLGHREPATTARYAHLAQDPVRQGAELVTGVISEALRAEPKEKVLPMPKPSRKK